MTLAASVIATAPAAASASVVLGHGAGGVSLGDTGTRVRSTLGNPVSATRYPGGQSWFYSGYWVTLDARKRVAGIEVKRPSPQTTAKGIGIGSSFAAFRAAYQGARCHPDPFNRVYRICNLATRVGGAAINNRFVFGPNKALALIDVGKIGEFA